MVDWSPDMEPITRVMTNDEHAMHGAWNGDRIAMAVR